MRNSVAKRLRKEAVLIAKEIYNKTSSVKTEKNTWQKGSPLWCYNQLKKAYRSLTRIEKENGRTLRANGTTR